MRGKPRSGAGPRKGRRLQAQLSGSRATHRQLCAPGWGQSVPSVGVASVFGRGPRLFELFAASSPYGVLTAAAADFTVPPLPHPDGSAISWLVADDLTPEFAKILRQSEDVPGIVAVSSIEGRVLTGIHVCHLRQG